MMKNKKIFFIATAIYTLFFTYQAKSQDASNSLAVDNTKAVKIGGQVWTAENLDVSKFRNGESILEAKSINEFIDACNAKVPAWCYYNNDIKNREKYGKIYNYYAVIDPKGLAPIGWHIPSDAEWKKLIDTLGGASIAGRDLKSEKGWDNGKKSTNSSGFNAIPGGELNGGYAATDFVPAFVDLGKYCCFWASNKSSMFTKPNRCLNADSDEVTLKSTYLNYGFYCRCIKD